MDGGGLCDDFEWLETWQKICFQNSKFFWVFRIISMAGGSTFLQPKFLQEEILPKPENNLGKYFKKNGKRQISAKIFH